jgi:hypothetical protein
MARSTPTIAQFRDQVGLDTCAVAVPKNRGDGANEVRGLEIERFLVQVSKKGLVEKTSCSDWPIIARYFPSFGPSFFRPPPYHPTEIEATAVSALAIAETKKALAFS